AGRPCERCSWRDPEWEYRSLTTGTDDTFRVPPHTGASSPIANRPGVPADVTGVDLLDDFSPCVSGAALAVLSRSSGPGRCRRETWRRGNKSGGAGINARLPHFSRVPVRCRELLPGGRR